VPGVPGRLRTGQADIWPTDRTPAECQPAKRAQRPAFRVLANVLRHYVTDK